MPSAVCSMYWMVPSGSTRNVARSAWLTPSRMFWKLRVMSPVESPSM